MKRIRQAVVAGLLLAAVQGCTVTPTSPEPIAPPGLGPGGMLARAEQRWAASRIAQYGYSISVGCFCPFPRPVRFEVRHGDSSAPGLDDRTRAWMARFESIDALFAMLHEHVQRNPARFEIEYHPTLGYPTKGYLDGSFNVADDELSFEVAEFTVLQ